MPINNWPQISYLYIWPESQAFKKAIQEGNNGQVYTAPVLKSEELLKDEVAEAIRELHNQGYQREETGFDKNALKTLIKEKRIKSALNLTTKILGHYGQSSQRQITFEIMEIWSCRFQLLMALKMYKLAYEEMALFGELDAVDLYLQYHNEYRQQNLSGTLVPFNLRLIHAEIPKYSAEMSKAHKRLSNLSETVQLIIQQNRLSQEQLIVWQKRLECVNLAMARLLYTLNDEQNVIALYRQIASQTTDTNLKREIQKMLVKLATIWGNSQMMDQFCNEVCSSGANNELCRTLRSIFYGKYQEAIDCLATNRSNLDLNANRNNNAVCLLYLGKVKESIDHLTETPILPIILNLFTVAELSSSNTAELRTQYFVRFSQQFGDMLEPRTLRIIK